MEQPERPHWKFDRNDQLRIQVLVEGGVTSPPVPSTVVLRLGSALSQQEWDFYQCVGHPFPQIEAAMSDAGARELGRRPLRAQTRGALPQTCAKVRSKAAPEELECPRGMSCLS
ncbi:hypothetical protein GGD55_004395 [Rhizobium giardinii]|uniref:Uncharacterized protein n=1 Tax=Rhizobium giardinii TaxID=56731 RepID=A0A7W8UGE2_9HYPH|nr:hypothetical protein [Rhizobium giardinii]